MNRLQWQFKTFPYSVTEKVGVFKTALTFVDSISEIWGPLLNGLAILVVRKAITQDPEKLVTLLEKYKVGIGSIVLTTSIYSHLIAQITLRKVIMTVSVREIQFTYENIKNWKCV